MSRSNNGREAERVQEIKNFLLLKGDFRYNVVLGKIEYRRKNTSDFVEMDDYILNSLARGLGEVDIKCSPAQLDNILKSDITPSYDPFKEYLQKLPVWDGTVDNIAELANTVETTNTSFWQDCLKRWLVAMVGSLEDKNTVNHTVLILVGPQGSGKTTWIDKLVPSQLRNNYYYSGTIKLDSKDTVIMLSESIVINLEEISSLTPTQLNELKEIITKKQIRLRRPYGRVNETLPRRASFTGSTNDKSILSDTTGSRRFLVFDVKKIDYQHCVDINLVISQALSLYRQGFKFWFDETEIPIINQNNEQYREVTAEEELLLQLFSPCNEMGATDFLTTTQIMVELNTRYKMPMSNATLQRIGKALRLHKFERAKENKKWVYLLRRNPDEAESCLRRVS